MSHPKVSILIPVYNGALFLAECIESILNQDFGDYELLISDDASTDGSVALIKHYAAQDPRIRWWRNPVNLGLSGNFNCCLRAASGEYIKYILQDDLALAPSAVRRMVEALDADPAVSLAGTGSHVIDAGSHLIEVRNNFHRTGAHTGKAVIVQCLEQNGNIIGEPTVTMFRRRQAGRGFDERYRQIVDLEFWFHLLEQGRFAYFAEPLFAFRVHPQSATASHQLTGHCAHEPLLLLMEYYRKPWMDEHATRRMWFMQIYYLRKKPGAQTGALTADMMTRIKPAWYVVNWLQTKPSTRSKN